LRKTLSERGFAQPVDTWRIAYAQTLVDEVHWYYTLYVQSIAQPEAPARRMMDKCIHVIDEMLHALGFKTFDQVERFFSIGPIVPEPLEIQDWNPNRYAILWLTMGRGDQIGRFNRLAEELEPAQSVGDPLDEPPFV
jgi:hypothetical protein